MHGVKSEPSQKKSTRRQVAGLMSHLIVSSRMIKYPMVIFVWPRPQAQTWGPSGSPINQQQIRAFLDMRTRLLLKSIIVSMDYVNMCIVWPSIHTLLKHAIYLGKKTVLSIMADNYYEIFTCHSTENKRIILSQKGFIHSFTSGTISEIF